jgi:peroxiredoxin-like protein
MRGTGQFQIGSLQGEYSVPREMTGPGVGTNPEELLVAAAHTCYLMTLSALLGVAAPAASEGKPLPLGAR